MNILKTLTLSALLSLFTVPQVGATDEGELIFVVNRDNQGTRITRAEVADLYLKRKRTWADGTPVRFVDRKFASRERRLFMMRILGKSESDIDQFWVGQKLYSGDSAPVQASSESLAMQLVALSKGAITYVASGASIDETSAKAITLDDGKNSP